MENTGEQNTKSEYADTLVLGLGVSGLSCARFLHYQNQAFAVADTREVPPGLNELREEMPDVVVHLGSMNDIASQSLKRLIVSPGISVKEPFIVAAKHKGVEVFGDIELFARNADAPVVAIAGSNGKSTVTTLLGEMAKAAGLKVKVGGNLGTPALQLLQQSFQQQSQIESESSATDYYILELSSFQLETTSSLNAVAAVVLNVSADHMDRYDSFAEYAAAKQRVYQGNGVMVTNADDDTVVAMEQVFLQAQPQRRVVRFTLRTPQQQEFGILKHQGEDWLAFGDKELLPVKELRIAGTHNQANALA
ncbi:UDP-N-acetylmuramoyl-L-alanine--D-glutamate ligase, partial [Kaarinaea lacus]